MSAEPMPNVGEDLIRIHKVITRALEISIPISQDCGLAAGQHAGYADYVRALTILLHAHHQGEDDLAFPFWELRLPAGPFAQLKEQHRQMIVFLERIEHWLGLGPTAWQPAALRELSLALAELQTLWLTHIALEEATVGPENSRQYLTPDENKQLAADLARHGQARAQPVELVLPFIVYNLAEADREAYGKLLPPVMFEQLIPMAWKPVWGQMTPFLLVD